MAVVEDSTIGTARTNRPHRSSMDLMTRDSANATKQWFGIVVEWTSVGSSTGSGRASSILFPESEFRPLGTRTL